MKHMIAGIGEGLLLLWGVGTPPALATCDLPLPKFIKEAKVAHLVDLTPGQLNWASGAYFVTSPVGTPVLPHDGGALATTEKDEYAIVWTKEVGRVTMICNLFSVTKEIADAIRGVSTAKGEDEL